MGRRLGRALAVLGALPLVACGTLSSYANGCPAPFSGVRSDREYLQDLGGLGNDALRWVTVSLDLPLSALADLLTLPIGALAERPPPTPVSPGCQWAVPRR